MFELVHDLTDSIAKEHPPYTPAGRLPDLVKDSDPIIHHTFDVSFANIETASGCSL